MIYGRTVVVLLAAFFDCGGGSGAVDPSESPVNEGAWQSERIVFADNTRGALLTIRDDAAERQILIELDDVACPTVSADGSRILANLLESNELILVRRSGDNTVFAGLSGGDLGAGVLTPDGLQAVFHEYTGDGGGSCPASQLVSANTNGTDLMSRSPGEVCARWPSIDDDATVISYEREDPSSGERQICMLEAQGFGDAGCLPIADLTGPHAWSPGGELLMGNDFRTWRTEDGAESSDPVDELKQLMPPEGQNELRAQIEGHLSGLGANLLAGQPVPLSLDWGPDDRIVFDAVTDGPGGTGVHIFIYDLQEDSVSHVAGPFSTAGGDEMPTFVCPKWIP